MECVKLPVPPERTRAVLDTIDAINSTLEFLSQSGCRGFEIGPQTMQQIEQWGVGPVVAIDTLAAVEKDLTNCQRCALAAKRHNIVFGSGDPHARLVFIGEGPGFEEDRQGLPFVGAAGQLLTRIIQAMSLTREQVYIANIIKCRPPGNRNPADEEIRSCWPFLKRQLAVIKPDFICALGTFAAQTLLETQAPISKLRGRLHDFEGIKVLPTYHPAYLLRNPEMKRAVWEDIKLLMQAMGLQPNA